VIRADDLARLSQEEIQFLDAIARKLALLALPASDTPQNQIESKPAIEAVGSEPGGLKGAKMSENLECGKKGFHSSGVMTFFMDSRLGR
jgi:hypothetical protein